MKTLLTLSFSILVAGMSSQVFSYDNNETEFQVSSSVASTSDSSITCTCVGGPGNYRYSCPPIKTVCRGGEGDYAYDCWVCPQSR